MASAKDIYAQITQAINPDNSNTRPTLGWIAGSFKRAYELNRIRRTLETRGDELDQPTRETYRNLVKLADIAIKNGLMKDDNGTLKVTPNGSKFVQELSKNIKEWENINDLSFKQLRGEVQAAKGEADQEWYNSLPPLDKHMIDLYSQITLKEFHFLTGIKNSKDGKDRYVNRIETLEDSDPESYNMLRGMGFITPKNAINNILVTNFFATLSKYDYRHLRSFNRSISSKTDRIAADKALVRNQLQRSLDADSPRSSEIALRAKEFVQNASECTKGWVTAMKDGGGVRCKDVDFDDLADKGIVEIGTRNLTDYGKVVASVIKNGDVGDERDTLNSRMPSGVGAPNDRQQQRSKILGGRSAEFNNRLNRTRAAGQGTNESKNLSFKKFLIESLDKQ